MGVEEVCEQETPGLEVARDEVEAGPPIGRGGQQVEGAERQDCRLEGVVVVETGHVLARKAKP